jgi:hypothetical protein
MSEASPVHLSRHESARGAAARRVIAAKGDSCKD